MSKQEKKGIFKKFSIGNEIKKENEGTAVEEVTKSVGITGEIEGIGDSKQTRAIQKIMGETEEQENVGTIRNKALPTKVGFWQKFKNFWLQDIDWNKEIKVVLTPKQQKIEDEINEFLHQEITWEKVHDFLFQEVKFGKNK